LPAEDYLEALLLDLEQDLPLTWGRSLSTVYFGGGTPSLFSGEQIDVLLARIRGMLQISPDAEITIEANPGTIERDSFRSYREAGINRVSLGAQSFDDDSLRRIGRIHASQEIEQAVESLHSAGISNFNIDLMYGLPGQTGKMAQADVARAIGCRPSHISHYQLTLEPNTAFAANPPVLPGDESRWNMQEQCGKQLAEAGFNAYEISAWCLPGKACRHNLNYWRFGDYLGIGAGAHGKLTLAAEGRIIRLAKQRHPKRYLAARKDGSWRAETRDLHGNDRIFEFFLNRLRLEEPIEKEAFSNCTGLPPESMTSMVDRAVEKGLIEDRGSALVQTDIGRRFNNDLQALFLP